jgi:hypothetical protein
MDAGDFDGIAVSHRIGEAVEKLTRGPRKTESVN